MNVLCFFFGCSWKLIRTIGLGRDLELHYKCRRCDYEATAIMSDQLEEVA